NTAANQHLHRVAGAVADRQDRDVGGDVARRRRQSAQALVSEIEILDLAREPDLAAELLDRAAERLHDRGEAVAAEMRAVIVDDRRLPLVLGEQLENAAHLGPGAAARQLAVAEGAGAPFAEEVIAVGLELAAVIEVVDVVDALADGAASFEHDR